MTIIIPSAAVKPPAMQFVAITLTDLGDNLHQVIVEFGLIRLEATNRLEEAEPLSRRHVAILCEFTVRTGHEHPHLRAALGNYGGILEAMGLGEAEVRERIGSLLEEYGVSLG